MADMTYNDISPRTQVRADRRLLERAKTNNVLGMFGQVRVLPKKGTQTIAFRRYNRLAPATAPLQEGVTPAGKNLTKHDVLCQVKQYGDWIRITDVVQDTHEDPVLRESIDVLGEQAGDTYDIIRAGYLKAGTNVAYVNGATRAAVNDVPTRDTIRTLVRLLGRQEAKPLKSVIKAGPNISTQPIGRAYIGVCHVDMKPDIERATGFVPYYQYANQGNVMEGEFGALGEVRFVIDNNLTPWADGGGLAATNATLSTTGTNSDVYPILIFGMDAYGIVPLGGKRSVMTYVNNPKAITGDEIAQRGSVGWKGWTGVCILNDLWMIRLESAAKG